jgi:hypothetical protein
VPGLLSAHPLDPDRHCDCTVSGWQERRVENAKGVKKATDSIKEDARKNTQKPGGKDLMAEAKAQVKKKEGSLDEQVDAELDALMNKPAGGDPVETPQQAPEPVEVIPVPSESLGKDALPEEDDL